MKNNTEYYYYFERCKECGKLKGNSDLYFCSGCGYGMYEDTKYAWKDVTLTSINKKVIFNE